MGNSKLQLTAELILAYRRTVGGLDTRLPWSSTGLRQAAWAGLQDSMPRAALLSIHARVEGTKPSALSDPNLIQVWGPRYSAYVVTAGDRAVFTLGRMPDGGQKRDLAEDLASRLADLLGDDSMPYGRAGKALGEPPNRLRYATLTGTIVIDWDGARQPTVRVMPRPETTAGEARLELARRHLHVFGPTTSGSFATWAGIPPRVAASAYETLGPELVPVSTPLGEAWALMSDEEMLHVVDFPSDGARLLPSGDAFYLLQGDDRSTLVPDPAHRSRLWTSRVWPGAVLVDGRIVGTWRRAGRKVAIETWRRLSAAERDRVVAEAESLPLEEGPIQVDFAPV